jgi:hypothetical protein
MMKREIACVGLAVVRTAIENHGSGASYRVSMGQVKMIWPPAAIS